MKKLLTLVGNLSVFASGKKGRKNKVKIERQLIKGSDGARRNAPLKSLLPFGLRIKMRANVVAAVLLFLALELADGVRASNPLDKQNCTYTLLVETTCAKDAGTSDHISVRFGDAKGTNILAHHLHASHVRRIDATSTYDVDDAPRVPFQACSVDQFHVTGTCVKSHVCYLYLKQNGKDRWRPGLAQVLVQEAHHLSSKSFYFRRFLPQHVWHGSDTCDTEVTPFGIKYTRKVFAPSKHAP